MPPPLPPAGGRRESRAIPPGTNLSTSSPARTPAWKAALASRSAIPSSGKSARSSLYRRSITRRDRCEMRSSVRRKAFLLKGLQNDSPLFGETILDLLEQDVGAGRRPRHRPGMLLHQRLDLPVE